ncbi:glycosyltransferase [Ascidiimonas aurantiaca]|uniref:glycosyltransferase n=1 Tax=Ascidiimonas aurantiaca TaxID=1685432 RepID=UPI0030EBB791
MKLTVVTHTIHNTHGTTYSAYAPYVKEMNIWFKHFNRVEVVAPLSPCKQPLTQAYATQISLIKVPGFQITGVLEVLKTIVKVPVIIFYLFRAFAHTDHIHIRCPGNMGLLGCLVQIFFPKKHKTVKYAGNWDPQSKQPVSYRLQKWILNNVFLTKNTKVLVYGEWPDTSKNIVPFFTATYQEAEKEPLSVRTYRKDLKFAFVGTLSPGKRPLFAIQLIEELQKLGYEATLDILGDGVMFETLRTYITQHELHTGIHLHGNLSANKVKQHLKESHFLILPSQSEGWPKAVAEAMFWGAIPITSKVSCLPWMLDNGKRGILIENNLVEAVKKIDSVLKNKDLLPILSDTAAQWSRIYTLEYFEEALKKLINT